MFRTSVICNDSFALLTFDLQANIDNSIILSIIMFSRTRYTSNDIIDATRY